MTPGMGAEAAELVGQTALRRDDSMIDGPDGDQLAERARLMLELSAKLYVLERDRLIEEVLAKLHVLEPAANRVVELTDEGTVDRNEAEIVHRHVAPG